MKILPLENSWKRTANKKLAKHYRFTPSANPDLIEGIDRFLQSHFRIRMYEAIGHRFVRELQHRLTVLPETQRMTRTEWRDFLKVPESTLSRWNRDLVMAGGQHYFVVHLLHLNLPVGAIPFPEPATMLSESVVSFVRHVRYKFLLIKETNSLTATTVNHLANLMFMMKRNSEFVYNPGGSSYEKTNMSGLRSYARKLFEARFAKQNLTPEQSAKELDNLTNEVKSWLDDWGLAYALLAVGYPSDWVAFRRD